MMPRYRINKDRDGRVVIQYFHALFSHNFFACALCWGWLLGPPLPHAADAVNGGGEIAIQTRRDDNQTVVEIIDNDPGISLENLSHIFKPFFTTKGVGSGKGLGLTISQGIVGDSTTVRSNSNQRQLKRDSSCDCRCCRLNETKAPAGTCSLPWQ